MFNWFGWAALGLLLAYLACFFWGNARSAQAAGRSVWLFGTARGRDRWAAVGFRAAFALSFLGPIAWLAFPGLHKLDPLWTEGGFPLIGLAGVGLACGGALLAIVAQVSMGASWRVGVQTGATGDLVSSGLFRFSRNPTFVGQAALLAGVALAIPSVPTILAALLFLWSATNQIRSEEAALRQSLGQEYARYAATVPRWIGLPRMGAK